MENSLDIKVLKVHRFVSESRIKAFVDISVNDSLLIKGLRVVEAKKGLFVSMPIETGKNEKWYERVRCLNQGVREEISQEVLKAYRRE
jgi:stage V sporulation protein G